MVSIDVNSGRSTQERGMEETAFKTNMEAGEEIARQLRLRDLGGLVVIDFIDMRDRKHIQEVERSLKNALKRDKARTEMSRISKFGLLEVSRQRLKPALQDETTLPCPHCKGQGLIRSKESLGLTVLRRIQAAAVKGSLLAAKAKVPLDAANYLLNEKRDRLLKLEQEYGIRIHVEGDATLTGSLFNLALEKKDLTAIEEEALEAAVEAFEETEVAEVEPFEEEVTVEGVELETASSPSDLVAELTPDLADAVASLAEATVSVEPNGAPALEELATDDNGSPLKHEVPSLPWQPPRRRLRFWWLRRLVPSSSRAVSELLRHNHVDDGRADSQPVAAAHMAPTLSPQDQRSAEAPNRLPDADAPWRRMLPPMRPPLLLPRTGADGAPPGDHLAV
jgi:ribonuclease E